MKHDNLEAAQCCLQAAREALLDELQQWPETFELSDALSLTTDALTQVRGEILNRLPTRYDWLGGAA